MTTFDFDGLDSWSRHKLLTSAIAPRPIAWVSTLSRDGIPNAAPFAFFNVFGTDPPVIALGIHDSEAGRSDTGVNIRDTKEFVVNLATADLLREIDITARAFPPEIDEFEEARLTKAPSSRVKPPRIAESPAAFECELVHELPLGPSRWLAVGRVLVLHIRDEAVNPASFHIDTPSLGLIARAEGGAYVRIGDKVPIPKELEAV